MPKEEGLKVSEEAAVVARDLLVRDCFISDGYGESFTEYFDRLREFGYGPQYAKGSKDLKDICLKANEKDPIWTALGFDPSYSKTIIACCDKIIDIMR